mgnify:FL=1
MTMSIVGLKLHIPKQESQHSYDNIIHMLEVIIELDHQEKVENFNQSCGFMSCNDDFVNQIGNHEKILSAGHSGASFGITMRICQKVLKDYKEFNKKLVQYNNFIDDAIGDIDKKIYTIEGVLEPFKEPNPNGSGSDYIFYDNMDDNNKKATDIAVKQGLDAAIKHMTTDANGQVRSYSEMRALYG